MSDEEERAVRHSLAACAPGDIGEAARLRARLCVLAKRQDRALCEACAGEGEIAREIEVRGMVAVRTLQQRFPCPACRTADYLAFADPAMRAWEAGGLEEADWIEAQALPEGDARERVLDQLRKERDYAERWRHERSWAEQREFSI